MTGLRQQPPRTMLEALVWQHRWSHHDFCDAYAQAARQLGISHGISSQHVGRWMGGKLKGLPYPAQCRVLERMFDMEVERLFEPLDRAALEPVTHRGIGGFSSQSTDPGEEVRMAAEESARFANLVEQTNVGPHTLEQFAADINRIAFVYPNRPIYPLFVELRSLCNRAFEKLEGRQFPNQSRDLYAITGLLCGLLANASFDLGQLGPAETQARTAFLCAELAGHNGLRAWIRGTQCLIAYWDDRPQAAVQLAEDGRQYVPATGTALVRLASIQARAYGRMRERAGVENAIALADKARDQVVGVDEPGGMMIFPEAKQHFYAATAHLWLGQDSNVTQAERDAAAAVDLYEQDPLEQRRLGELNLARLDLAAARLALGHLDATAAEVRTVIQIAGRRPTDSVAKRLRQVAVTLARQQYHGNHIAIELRDEISAFATSTPLPVITDIMR